MTKIDLDKLADEMIKDKKESFIKRAVEKGFSQSQAEFLWYEIKSSVALDATFGLF